VNLFDEAIQDADAIASFQQLAGDRAPDEPSAASDQYPLWQFSTPYCCFSTVVWYYCCCYC
jgi:hypothetical protein